MSAKLSSTLAGMALLQFPLLLFVLGPFLGQRFIPRLALENAAPLFDQRGGDGFQENPLRRVLNHSFCPVLNVKLFPQPSGNDHLAFCCEPNSVRFYCRTHVSKDDVFIKLRQEMICRKQTDLSDIQSCWLTLIHLP